MKRRESESAKHPRERLIFSTVVALLSLEQWRNVHGTNRPDENH